MDPSRHKDFPLEENKQRKAEKENGRAKVLAKVLFEKPSVDWRHRPGSLRVDQLICTSVVALLDDVGSFPLRLELPRRLVCDGNGASKH